MKKFLILLSVTLSAVCFAEIRKNLEKGPAGIVIPTQKEEFQAPGMSWQDSLKTIFHARFHSITPQETDSLRKTIAILRAHNHALEALLQDSRNEAEKRYYRVDSFRNLAEMNVIERVKGLTLQYRLSNRVDCSLLHETSVHAIDSLRIDAPKIEVLGAFPKEAYEVIGDLEREENLLVITDPERFWQNDQILIVAYK